MTLPIRTRLIPGWISGFCILLAGCSTLKNPVLPEQGPTMTQIYRKEIPPSEAGSALTQARGKITTRLSALPANDGAVRSQRVETAFPQLPNPTVTMYIYPHLAGQEEAPIPGYTTAFEMYQHDHFALPGEVNKRGHA